MRLLDLELLFQKECTFIKWTGHATLLPQTKSRHIDIGNDDQPIFHTDIGTAYYELDFNPSESQNCTKFVIFTLLGLRT